MVAGIDFGKRHVRLALSDLSHALLAERHLPLDADLPAKEAIALAARLFADALEEAEVARDEVVGVGMGLPGPVHRPSGELGNSTILPGWAGTRASQAVEQALGFPVEVENDANLGALGEWMWGAGARRRPHGLREGLDRHRRGLHRRREPVRRRGRDGRRARPHGRRPGRPDLPLRQPRLPGDLRRRARDPRLAARRPRRGADAARGGGLRGARRRGLRAGDRRRRHGHRHRRGHAVQPLQPAPRRGRRRPRRGGRAAARAAAGIVGAGARSARPRRTSRSSRASWATAPKCWELLRLC